MEKLILTGCSCNSHQKKPNGYNVLALGLRQPFLQDPTVCIPFGCLCKNRGEGQGMHCWNTDVDHPEAQPAEVSTIHHLKIRDFFTSFPSPLVDKVGCLVLMSHHLSPCSLLPIEVKLEHLKSSLMSSELSKNIFVTNSLGYGLANLTIFFGGGFNHNLT